MGSQYLPLPLYPWRQTQLNIPTALVHVAFPSQSSVPSEHSFTSSHSTAFPVIPALHLRKHLYSHKSFQFQQSGFLHQSIPLPLWKIGRQMYNNYVLDVFICKDSHTLRLIVVVAAWDVSRQPISFGFVLHDHEAPFLDLFPVAV